ncbi:DUF885 domain-containing protein [Aliikangiella maris]|uniref:DUF885 domain-containing protein n=2 Tax=Aliikangiella maris TaxID=3162458 RepID=A0ABV2BPA6_9GAMM
MKIKLLGCLLASSILLISCNQQTQQANEISKQAPLPVAQSEKNPSQKTLNPEQTLNKLYQQATKVLFQSRAASATLYGLSEKDVGIYFANRLENYSEKNEQKLRQQLHQISQQIRAVKVPSDNRIATENQQVMAHLTRYFAGIPDFNMGYIDVWMGLSPFVINQINGPLIDIPRYMQSDQAVKNEKQAQDYIQRLEEFDHFVDSVLQKQLADANKNWIPPKIILQGSVRYINNFLADAPEKNPLVTSFIEKLDQVDNLNKEQKAKLIAQAISAVTQQVYPAYEKALKQTENLIEKAREESGIWAQPSGEKYYQDAILQLGDSELDAEQIHQVGVSEVERISNTMNRILKSQGYQSGSVGERMNELAKEPRFLYEDSAEGRKQLLADLNLQIKEISELMQPLFKTNPNYTVEVRSFPAAIQDGAPGGQYTPPAIDGTKPGIYWINLKDIKANPKFGLKTLTYHEASPGHHWQGSLNLEQDALPLLRRIAPYNAYAEGWALYAEKVAAELGVYKDDPFGDLGRLQAELFRAVRLVVDTGIHHKRWSREQAIEYMAAKTGTAKSDVTREIERYMAWPGQALGYKLGMLKILSLRDKAQKQLKDKFDLAEFHDLILLGGAVSMKVLTQKVDTWIALKQAS